MRVSTDVMNMRVDFCILQVARRAHENFIEQKIFIDH